LSELELPVLMFYGKNDKLVPHHILHPDMDTQEIAELGEEKMKNGKLVLFSECGHFVQWERAEEVSEALGNWGKK